MEENKRDAREKTGATPSRGSAAKEGKKDIKEFFKNIRGEYSKIIWPSRKELAKQTATVMVTSLIVGAVIVVYDGVFSTALKYFAAFVGK